MMTFDLSTSDTRISRRHNSYDAVVAFSLFALISFVMMFFAQSTQTVCAAPAPVVDATAQTKDVQNRLQRIENRLDNLGVVDLIRRLDTLQREIQQMVGNLEVQMHELKSLQETQRKTYVDLDARIRKLEEALMARGGAAATPGVSGQFSSVPVGPATGVSQVPVTPVGPAGTGAAAPTTPPLQVASQTAPGEDLDQQIARSAYERAFNLLKQKRYDMAIASFTAFLEAYPNAGYADNAQYWLGEANYAKQRYPEALEEFKKVVDKYPDSPKRADAMLKMGYTYSELGKKDLAKKTLDSIITSFPGSTAARLAQQRLRDIKSTN